MERHIKQQHPQHWCQKPRGSRRNHTATVPVIAPQFRSSQDSEDTGSTEINVTKIPEDNTDSTGQDNKINGVGISEQVKTSTHPNDKSMMDKSENSIEEPFDMDEEEEEGFEVGSEDGGSLIIDEPSTSSNPGPQEDLASVSKLLNTASNQSFQKYFDQEEDELSSGAGSNPGGNQKDGAGGERKKSAYSAAPHKIACPYCERKFPWTSSLKRHILTHTGHKPYKCAECSLWFTTKSNCDRHLLRKHGGSPSVLNNNDNNHSLESSASITSQPNITTVSTTAPSGGTINNYTMRNVPDRPHKCKMCPSSSFSSQSNLRKHQLSKHLNMDLNDQEIDVEHDDVEHEEDLEGDDEDEESNANTESSKFRCHICSLGFELRAIALSHMRASHSDECASIESLINSKLEANIEKPLMNAKGNMNGNMTAGNTNGNGNLECIFCPFVSRTFLELRRHVSRDHGVKYTCDVCQKSFSLKKLLVRHKKKHDSGVSSGGEESEDNLEVVNNAKNNSITNGLLNTTISVTNSLSMVRKNKPSLMDTINKLSSKKNKEVSSTAGSKNQLDNLFQNNKIENKC